MGGAKNCPETPRQKMIGMMYLVLTAMLALNVSADILNGFNKLRKSMESSIISTEGRTNDLMRTFEAAYSKDEGGMKKYGEWWAVAQANKQMSDEFYDYIENFKMDIVRMVEGKVKGVELTEMPKTIKNGSDTNKPHEYALTQRGESGKIHAVEFKERMDQYRVYMTTAKSECIQRKMADPKFAHEWNEKVQMFSDLFNTSDVRNDEGETIPWEQSIFDEMPAGAVFAMLTKYQNDVRLAENDLLEFLFKSAGSSDFVINSVQALIIPDNGEYIMKGGHYRARIVSAAVDTTNLPVVFINGKEYPNGVYDIVAGSVGQQTYRGYMLMPGDTTHYEFKGQYTVGEPSVTISNKDMDIIYSGYDNKYDISVPGVPTDKLKVSAVGAKIDRRNGVWIVQPQTAAKTVTISVQAEVDGKLTNMGSQSFRVKPLPKPSCFFVANEVTYDGSVKVAKKALTAADAHLEASYGPDGVLNLPFTIKSFEMYAGGRMIQATGNVFNKDMINAISKMKSNEMLNILTIKYQEPGGAIKTLPNFGLIIK